MIELQGISKSFGDNRVLEGVDLHVDAGETHVILGRSGEGKSVTLKLICGLMAPDAGSIVVDGFEVDIRRPRSLHRCRRKIQMLFQGGALFDSLTVAQNVAFHAVEHNRLGGRDPADFANEFLEMVDLADSGHLMPAELSGGMRKRAALARSLAAHPKVMLYDEPTTGLDPITCQVINRLIRQTQRRLRVTSVVVTHDIRSAQEVGDRVSFMHEGRILETTTPDRLSGSPNAIVRSFIENAAVSL